MSDILIRGIEMPTTCGKCRIKNAIECDRWKLVRSVALDRHRDCPLVPVPEPHGRLIDVNALEYEEAYLNGHYELGDVEIITRKDIELAPTIIPASEENK